MTYRRVSRSKIGRKLGNQRFKMPVGALAVLVAATLVMGGPASGALAASTNMGDYFRASNYNANAHKKEGTLTATGTLCKKAFTKKGYLVKGSMTVNAVSGTFKSSQRFNAYIWTSKGGGSNGPDKAVKKGAKSSAPYTSVYLKGTDKVALYIYSQTLTTGTSAEATVSNLATCN